MKKLLLAICLIASSGSAFATDYWVQTYLSQPTTFYYGSVVTNPEEVFQVSNGTWTIDITRTLPIKEVTGDTNSAPNWVYELATLVYPPTSINRSIDEDQIVSTSKPTVWWSYYQQTSNQTFRLYYDETPTGVYVSRTGFERTQATFYYVAYTGGDD